MRITVFGAAGNVGRRVVAEARARGHEVTAVVRERPGGHPVSRETWRPPVHIRTGDATDPADVARLAAGQDVVIGATRPAPGSEHLLVTATEGLLAGLAGTGTRLLLVGGAGSLTLPGGGAVLDDPSWVPAAWRPIAQACTDQLAVCRRTGDAVDWTYVSPPALLEPGTRTGTYRVGRDELLVDERGNSTVSMEDFAIALLDEAERPRHRGTRFTVGY
ncbi:NAD(P)H-binding protein [Streptomyces sp. AV19]|uniref:NAD(P)-dependent oxidoreductase n=1 Tax=Streptomyces sp. AV19 TaxID=2793068 RepID=UPI0018FE5B17|nr:NAD(P)H-binding protein [Streptomyces sp. AV19]MBH1933209.1 NAD(P)H-binding protein [Streptomyces sp. AV19]MDG4530691.1 NAD(P)H-binding protein [Streptomyces sp. AV19]